MKNAGSQGGAETLRNENVHPFMLENNETATGLAKSRNAAVNGSKTHQNRMLVTDLQQQFDHQTMHPLHFMTIGPPINSTQTLKK
jgi:hypothetical protein